MLLVQCEGQIYLETSNKVNGSGTKKTRYAVNIGAVWGQLVTGGGHSSLNEAAAALDLPGMLHKTFTNIEEQIGKA